MDKRQINRNVAGISGMLRSQRKPMPWWQWVILLAMVVVALAGASLALAAIIRAGSAWIS